MTNSAITPAEWKEIEGYLLERPQCSIDETGAIWLRSSNHGLTCMHPRTFLDICRDPSGSGYREPIQNVASVVYQDDLAIVEDLGPCLTVAGIRAIKKQLMGEYSDRIRKQMEEAGPGHDLFEPPKGK